MQRSAGLAALLADQSSRLALKKFAQALKAAQHRAKKQLLEQVPIEVLFGAFPCWASTDRYLSHILPLRAGLFDLAIVDEASQVDLAAATPAVFRGKRAVIVGDPKQLRFVSFLSTAAETAALARHEVPASYQVTHRFSRRSLFDVGDDAVPQRATFILDEHFRSQRHIIGFSNDRFYDRAMRIMTQRPHSEGAKAIEVRYVGGRRAGPANRNDAELEAAMEVVASVIEEAEAGGPVRSIGLLSPFRDQANALNKAITERFPQYIAPHGIVCGTAHSLQGDERDVVVFSTVIDPGFHHGSLRFLETPNLFNVAITRAAKRLVVVTSVKPEDLPGGETNYLALLMRHAERPADPAAQPDHFRSQFEREVAEALRQRGLVVISAYPSCGYEIDLVASDGHHSVAVECDGHPSHFNADGTYTTDDVIRHIRLWRAGWDIYRLPLSEWRADPDGKVLAIAEYVANPPVRPAPSSPELPASARHPAASPARTSVKATRTTKKAGAAKKSTKRPSAATKRLPVTSSRCSCGGKWVLRRGRYGTFYGCSRYPRCRRTRSAR
jgi:hypothetical protein